MPRTWAVAWGAAAVLTASVAGAQEWVQQDPRQVVKLRAEAEQLPVVVKMRVPLESKVVMGAPYSAEVVSESIETLTDGNRIVRRTTGRVYRDGQGRVRREDEKPGQASYVTIMDPVVGVSYYLDPEARIAWKIAIRSGSFSFNGDTWVIPDAGDPADVERKRILEKKLLAAAQEEADMGKAKASALDNEKAALLELKRRQGPQAWEESVEKLDPRQIEGVSAEGTRTTRTIPAGAIGNERPIVMVTEEWRSPELQVLVLTTTSDPRTGESTYKLTNIVRGEPGASWFEVPAGYTLREKEAGQNLIMKRDAK